MSCKNWVAWLVMVIVLSMTVWLRADIAATTPAVTAPVATAPAGPAEVNISIYVISLGKFDVGSGAFTVDFYLDLKHPEGFNPEFEFCNGRATSTDKIIDTSTEKFYRIQANLVSPVDLKRFPFDHQTMQITLEDKKSTIDKMVFVPMLKETHVDESVVFTGWKYEGWSAEVRNHDYPSWDEKYSQYIFTVKIARIGMNSFMKTFLPVFFIVLVVLCSFVMRPDKVTTRMGMAGSGLVASVMFHVSISNQIPPVGYLTFADKFMVLTYLFMLASFVLNVVIMAAQEHKNERLVNRIHHATESTMFILTPVAYVSLFAFFS